MTLSSPPLDDHTITIDQVPVFYRSADILARSEAVPVYLHTAPTSSDDWLSALEETGGIAPDLVGFGRSGKGGHLDYTPDGIARFVAALLAELDVERIHVVGHGWGAAVAVALAASGVPVERLVLLDAAPPLESDGWPRPARIWRRYLIGELAMGSISRRMLARMLRGASATTMAWPPARIEAVWEQFDQGTQRATLRLHRWADAQRVRELDAALESLSAPALVLWGERDTWFPPRLADAWVRRLPGATLEVVPEAGHWPWLDRPEVVGRIGAFLSGQ